ncbi:MAG: peptidylprolyl isomerase [Candidatus Eremiobacteraeota bacterium]|nr:peptidylprolyl isomerase [Candidatus Eremiobacteraeota bacterium]
MSKVHRLLTGVATALLTVSLAACQGSGSGGSVVTVNGQGVSHADFDKQLENSPSARQVLQTMVTNTLLDQYAKQNNITVSDADIDKVVNQYKTQYPNGEFDTLLKARGMSEADFRNLIRPQLIVDKAVGGNIKISDADIAAYFKKNRAAFDTPSEVHARHILVPDLKTANKVEADLKSGKDFAAEAKQYSQDPGSKDKGGDLGWQRKGGLVPAFEKYAYTAPLNQTSPPIKSPFGYHIIQVIERKPAKVAKLSDVHDQIALTLRQQQEAPLVSPFIQGLLQKAKIDVNDPRFAGVFPSPAPAPGASAAPAASAPSPTNT